MIVDKMNIKEDKKGCYDCIHKNMYFVGVTGTESEITINLIEHILKHANLKTGVISSNYIKFCDELMRINFSNFKFERLQYILDKMIKDGIQVVIMEVSSDILYFNKMNNLEFDIALYISAENTQSSYHKNSQDFHKLQKELFYELSKDKIAIINIDDSNSLKLIKGNNKALVVTYGLNNKASLTASSISIKDYINLVVCLQRGLTTIQGVEIDILEFPITLKLSSEQYIYITLASIAVALCLNIDIEIIKKSLILFNGIE